MVKRNSLGKLGEEFACQLLVSKGHKILHKNYSSRWGEIDIISLCRKELFFVEVKTRSTLKMGYPSEAVTKNKLEKMNLTALTYLSNTKACYDRWSFKVIEILVNEIDDCY